MSLRVTVLFLLICIPVTIIRSETDSQDVNALLSLKQLWNNIPPSWNHGNDPCGDQWEGIACRDSRVISIMLSSMGLRGLLPDDIQGLSELETLDLSYNKELTGSLPPAIGNLANLNKLILAGCNFNGQLPDTIGSLSELRFLSLNSNRFSGTIPQTFGNLSKLKWLDLAANKLSGNIPTNGLDRLVHVELFNFGRNQLSGEIPPQLFKKNMNLIHLLLDNNQFSGTIPITLCLVRTLKTIRFDGNSLNGSVPSCINTLIGLKTMRFSDNKLGGQIPDLTGMIHLSYLDMSNNSFEVANVPTWFTALPELTTLMMEQTQIQGVIQTKVFNLPWLQKVVLKNNKLSGTLDIGAAHSPRLQFVDLQNNSISVYIQRSADNSLQLTLVGNPVCGTILAELSHSCVLPEPNPSYSTPQNCKAVPCTSDKTSSPSCHCSYPYSGTLTFVAPQFPYLKNFRNYGAALEQALLKNLVSREIPVDSVSISHIYSDTSNDLRITLKIFPLGQDGFSRKNISTIAHEFSSQTIKLPSSFGPVTFLPDKYTTFLDGSESTSKSKSRNILLIIGSIVGSILTLLGALGIRQLCKKCSFSINDNCSYSSFSLTCFQRIDTHPEPPSVELQGRRKHSDNSRVDLVAPVVRPMSQVLGDHAPVDPPPVKLPVHRMHGDSSRASEAGPVKRIKSTMMDSLFDASDSDSDCAEGKPHER